MNIIVKRFAKFITQCSQSLLLLSICFGTAKAADNDASPHAADTVLSLEAIASLFSQHATVTELQSLSTQLQMTSAMRGNFRQYRHLKVLKKPLVSTGEFIFDQNMGLLWQQNTPFTSQLILKDQQLIQINSQGEIQISDSANVNGAAAIGEMMPILVSAMLSGELSGLSSHFDLYYQAASDSQKQWQLGLVPKDPMVQKAIASIVLEGDRQIHSLTLMNQAVNSTSGTQNDYTRIEFFELIPGVLSPEEAARFDPISAPQVIPQEPAA